MFSYTMSGAHKQAKMVIDYITIALTVLICVLFIILVFLRSRGMLLFPVEFMAGGTLNLLTGIKQIFNRKKGHGVFLIVIAVALYVFGFLCLGAYL